MPHHAAAAAPTSVRAATLGDPLLAGITWPGAPAYLQRHGTHGPHEVLVVASLLEQAHGRLHAMQRRVDERKTNVTVGR